MQHGLNRVLLVDDDKVTNLLHRRVFERSGLVGQIDVATDGLAALEYLQALEPDADPAPELIVLDINMPRMNGFEFLESYAQMPESLRAGQTIIVVSTSMLNKDRARAEADPNVHRFASKPLAGADVEAFVAHCLIVRAGLSRGLAS